MKKHYEHVNTFELGVVSMIMVGFVLIGVIVFAGLTPRSQSRVATAFNMFDLHEQVASTVSETTNIIQFVMDVPNEFYNQFYIAFTQVATLPSETFEVPAQIATEISRNISVAINDLSDQVSRGYLAQNSTTLAKADAVGQGSEVAFSGKVLGAVIDISNAISTGEIFNNPEISTSSMTAPVKDWDLPYHYEAPSISSLKLSFTKLINQ